MRFDSVAIINFKSIGEYEQSKVIIEPDVTAIIGKNESGKSNIIEALSYQSIKKITEEAFQRDNINRNKKKGIALKTYKTSINMNQKAFYNDYLYGNKKKIQGQEIDQKFLPYYKEIYGDGEATPEKDE